MKKTGMADLHLHLDGSISVELLGQLAKENSVDLHGKDIKQLVSVQPDCRNLEDYLRCFDFVTPLLQKEQALTRAVVDLIQRLEEQGLVYAEIRFAPQLHTIKGMRQQQAVEAVLRGVDLAKQKGTSIKIGILLCMMVTGNLFDNQETAELAAAYHGKGVVGLDLAGAEGAVPMNRFEGLFAAAYKADVPFTIHAGECKSYENVARAVSFGAKRIGHGCGAVYSKECMELLRREKIVVESCPTSNLQTRAVASLKEHPIRRFYDEGILVTVNTDNMTVSGTTLEREYKLLAEQMGFTEQELEDIRQTALHAGFA